MIAHNPPTILRIYKLERWADARHHKAISQGQTHRAFETANLIKRLHRRSNEVALADVAPYRA